MDEQQEKQKNQRVRVRIAPSPTGDPHVGTLYTALFNYVFAKKSGGDFVLRIEDTDQKRAKDSSEEMIFTALRWVGLEWDEGPDVGGDFGPYRQSERKEIYREHAELLLKNGTAYRDFDAPERTSQMRKEMQKQGAKVYERPARNMSIEESQSKADAGEPFVVRLKMPLDGVTVINDRLRGQIEIQNSQIDDQILLKSDGFPTYHLANVVDDHLMQISHVIRAEEWISSTPKHIQLYKAFGWQEPEWVHLPLLRNGDKSKISKRKNPTSVNYYKRAGILPATLINFLALMGWSFGDDKEKFSLAEMVDRFELDRINVGDPIFDQKKLSWLNQQYIQNLSSESFIHYIKEDLFSSEYLRAIFPLVKERFERFDQFIDKHSFFFNGALDYSELPLPPKGIDVAEMNKMVKGLVAKLDETYDWSAASLQAAMDSEKEAMGWKPRDYYLSVRFITTGRKDSPPLAETLEVLGRDIVRYRLRDYLAGQSK